MAHQRLMLTYGLLRARSAIVVLSQQLGLFFTLDETNYKTLGHLHTGRGSIRKTDCTRASNTVSGLAHIIAAGR